MNLAIISAGMVTSVGFNAPATYAAIRAGISGLNEFYLTDYIGSSEGLNVGKVELPQWWNSLERLADLVAPAIYECLSPIPQQEWIKIPILLGVALPDVPVLGDVFQSNLLGIIETKLGLPHHPESEIFPYGHTSGIHALIKAKQLMTTSPTQYCVIAGADSYLQQETIQHYIQHRRIMASDNSNGFFPGEAGTATLVGLSDHFPHAQIHIIGLGQGNEPATIMSEEPFSITGMSQALKQMQVESSISLDQIKTSLSDLNGEYYKFNEINLTLSRFNSIEKPVEIINFEHPTEYLGEIGAAILPCLLNIAYLSAGKPYYRKDKYLLIHIGNDKTERAAITLKVN